MEEDTAYTIRLTPTPAGWRLELNGAWIGNILHTVNDKPLDHLLAVPQSPNHITEAFVANGRAVGYLIDVALE